MSPPDPAIPELDTLQSQWRIQDLEQPEAELGDLMDMQNQFGNDAMSGLLDGEPGGPPPMSGGGPLLSGGDPAAAAPDGSTGDEPLMSHLDGEEPMMSELGPDEGTAPPDVTGDGPLMSEMPAEPLMSQAPADPLMSQEPAGGGGGAGGGGPEPGAGGGPGVEPALAQDVPAPEPAETALEDSGAAQLGTGDLALIDEELAEHARWGGALGEVGETASPQRAEFVANAVSSGMGDSAVQGAGMSVLITGGTKLAERYGAKFVPIPAVGAIIGGVMAGVGLWDTYQNWDAPGGGGESLSNIGEGASGYEVAANTIQGIVTILDLSANLLDVLGGISGVVAAACAVAILASLGTLAPVLGPIVATATKIAITISVVTGIMNIIKMALQPLVMLFRALHSFHSEADPRDVQAQGAALTRAGAELGGTVGGLAAGKATEKAAGRLGAPPAPGSHLDGLDPSAPRDRGPEVEIDPTTGPRSAADADGPNTFPMADVDGAPRLELDVDGTPRPSTDADGPNTFPMTDVEGAPRLELDVDGTGSVPSHPPGDGPRLESGDMVSDLRPVHDQTRIPTGVEPGATHRYGSPPQGRQAANVESEHITPAAILRDTRPNYEYDHPTSGRARGGRSVRDAVTTILPEPTADYKTRFDQQRQREVNARVAQGEHVDWVGESVAGRERTHDAMTAMSDQTPREFIDRGWLMEMDQNRVGAEGDSRQQFRDSGVTDAEIDAHLDALFDPHIVRPPAAAEHDLVDLPESVGPVPDLDLSGTIPHASMPDPSVVNLPEGTGPVPDLDLSGVSSPGPMPEHNLVDLPEGGGRAPLLDMPQADPRLLGPDTRALYTGMESGGAEFHEGGSMSRMADHAETVGLGARTSGAKTLASAYNTATSPPPGTVTGSGLQGEAYADVQGPEGATGAELAELRAEAEVNVEPVNPAYPEPPCSEADLARMEDDIEAVLAERAQAEADAAEMEASAQCAEQNQSTAEAVVDQTSSVAGPAAQAHAALVARRQQRNQEQQQKLQQSKEQSMNAAEEVAGTGTLLSLLSVWSGFTGLMSYLPGSVGSSFEEMNRDSNTFIEKLAEAKGLIEAEAQAGEPRLGEAEANAGQIEATAAENAGNQSTIGQAAADASTIADQQGEQASEAHESADMCQADAEEAATVADGMAAEHESLAAELQAWSEEHKNARTLAVEETSARLMEQGYTVTRTCDW